VDLNKGAQGFAVYDVSGRQVWQYGRSSKDARLQSVSLPSHLQGMLYVKFTGE
jgi:hypothetical protein